MSVSTARRALIEEDDVVNQQLLRLVLSRAGFTTDIASDSDSAITAAATDDYDMVVVDFARLGVRALATAWAIRHLPHTRVRRIVAVAPSASAAERASCREAGIDDIVTDPRELDNIARTIMRQVHSGSSGSITASARPDVDPDVVLSLDLLIDLADQPQSERRELVSLIDGRTSELLKEIAEAMDGGQPSLAELSARRLTGIASIVRAGRLARYCLALQEALRVDQIDDARLLVAALAGEQVALVNELCDQLLDDPDRPPGP